MNNIVILAEHYDLVFKIFIFGKIKSFAVYNFYYPSTEIWKNDDRKIIKNTVS